MDLIDSLGFLLSAYNIFNFHKDLHFLWEEFASIKASKVYTPSSFLEDLPQIKKNLSLNDISKTNQNEIMVQGFVQGIVHSNNFISSSLKETIKLIYKMSFSSKIYDNDKFVNNVTLLKQIPKKTDVKQLPFFDLKDYDSKSSCRVYKNFNVVANQALNIIKTHSLLKNNVSIFQRILSFFYIFFQIISLFAEDKLSYKGVQVGNCDVELGIETNSFLMVYGEIIYNFVTKSLRIEKPEYFLKDKSFVLDEIAKKIRKKRILLIVYILVNFYCGYKLVRKFYTKLKNWFKEKEEQEDLKLKSLDKFRQFETMKCVVCFQQVRNIIFKPCKHLAICHLCLRNIRRTKKCPICKDQFHSYVEIFTK